ncbi:hypothetical protein KOW79_017786 [Hemibagrus wyckioides]|uniref:Uncharacterized protein n=1 Tax=Hemibagrus wyckioides TaxID=337641 RepID=A0A9D3SCQ8_9TELE|nr:hypothetical protein KOW79_017786 [Hemibagrus wyckioides]
MLDLYSHYKFYHFFSICFGLGCGLCSYRPYYSLVMPVVLTGFSMFAFEAVGWCLGLPPHTKQCKGPPFHRRDALWGFVCALLVAVLHLRSYHVYTLSYGSGIVVFSIRGAKRRYSTLWNYWNTDHTSSTRTNKNTGHASFTGTNWNRGNASFTGTNWNRGNASFTGTNWNRGHAYFTRTGWNRGHTSSTGAE